METNWRLWFRMAGFMSQPIQERLGPKPAHLTRQIRTGLPSRLQRMEQNWWRRFMAVVFTFRPIQAPPGHKPVRQARTGFLAHLPRMEESWQRRFRAAAFTPRPIQEPVGLRTACPSPVGEASLHPPTEAVW